LSSQLQYPQSKLAFTPFSSPSGVFVHNYFSMSTFFFRFFPPRCPQSLFQSLYFSSTPSSSWLLFLPTSLVDLVFLMGSCGQNQEPSCFTRPTPCVTNRFLFLSVLPHFSSFLFFYDFCLPFFSPSFILFFPLLALYFTALVWFLILLMTPFSFPFCLYLSPPSTRLRKMPPSRSSVCRPNAFFRSYQTPPTTVAILCVSHYGPSSTLTPTPLLRVCPPPPIFLSCHSDLFLVSSCEKNESVFFSYHNPLDSENTLPPVF